MPWSPRRRPATGTSTLPAQYGNEAEVGQGIDRRSGVARDEVFVTTKLWIADYPATTPRCDAFDASPETAGLEYVDLYLLRHWPAPQPTFASTIAGVPSRGVHCRRRSRACDRRLQPPCRGTSRRSPRTQLRPHAGGQPGGTPPPPGVQPAERLRHRHQELGIVTQSWSPLGGSGARRARVAGDRRDRASASGARRGRSCCAGTCRTGWSPSRGRANPAAHRRERRGVRLRADATTTSPRSPALSRGPNAGVDSDREGH